MKPERVFKIQNGQGEFRAGRGDFGKKGKLWNHLGHVVQAIRFKLDLYVSTPGRPWEYRKKTPEELLEGLPADWDVVEYEIREVRRIPVRELMTGKLS